MLSKQKILVSLAIVVMVVAAGIAFGAGYIVKGFVHSSNSPYSVQAALPDSTQTSTPSSQEGNDGIQAKNISMRLGATTTSANRVQAEVCIQLPSTENWVPEASLVAGGQTIPANGWVMLNSKDPSTYTSSNRCYQLSFAIPNEVQTQAAPLQIEVERLFIPPPTMPTEEQCAQAQQKLDAASSGIKFTCNLQPDRGAWGYDVQQRPQGMSDEQVASLIFGALREKVVEGPWMFILNISN